MNIELPKLGGRKPIECTNGGGGGGGGGENICFG